MIIVRTPLRVSLFGGGTDFPEYFERRGGGVIGSAIDKYIYHTISQFPSWLFDHKIRFAYKIVEHAKNIEEIKHLPFKEILRYSKIFENIEVNLASDLPSFTGLGSSSSFTVGLIKGLEAFKGNLISEKALAKTAIHIERKILKESVGFQDQIFASYGGFNYVKFNGANNFEVERMGVSDSVSKKLSESLIMIYTGMTRRASEIEKNKLQRLDKNYSLLDSIHDCLVEAKDILFSGGDLSGIGRLLNDSWLIKRDLSGEVTNPFIDEIYRRALESGALGGKLLGAGGGGFLLFYVPKKSQSRFRREMHGLHEVKFSLNAQGSSVIHVGS